MRRSSAWNLSCLLVSLVAAACTDDALGPKGEAELPFSFEFASTGITTFDLQGTTGSVTTVGSEPGSSIRIEGFRRVRARTSSQAIAHLPDLTVDASRIGSSIVVITDQPAATGDIEYVVDFVVRLPADIDVTIDLVTGAVVAESLTGSMDAQVVTGSVVLDDVQGPLSVSLTTGTVAGSVTLPEGASISIAVVTGALSLSVPRNAPGMLTASVVTGTLSMSGLYAPDQDPRPGVARMQLADGSGVIDLSLVTGTLVLTGR